jgi:hypothetical protein
MKLKFNLGLAFILISYSLSLYAQSNSVGTPGKNQLKGDATLPNLNNQNRTVGDSIFPVLTNQEIDGQLKQNMQQSAKILSQGLHPVPTPVPAPAANIPQPAAAPVVTHVTPPANVPMNVNNFNPPAPYLNVQPPAPSYFDLPNGVRIFTSNIHTKQLAEKTIELPATSVALGHLMEGIEVGQTNDSQTIGLTLDYAFLGPNGGYVQMQGCNLLVRVYAKIAFSRIRGDLMSMTCRSPNGQTFTIPVQGHLISSEDKKEYKGLNGTVIMPGKFTAAMLTLLQGATKAFGEAMAAAQVSTQATSGQVGTPVQSSNVSGNQNYYIGGQTIAGAAGNFMNWFVDFYKGLDVGIAVEQGRKTFVMLEQTVLVPKEFFGPQIPKQVVSYINEKVSSMDNDDSTENNENKDSNFNTAIVDPSSSSIFEKNNIMKDKRS